MTAKPLTLPQSLRVCDDQARKAYDPYVPERVIDK